MDNVKAFAGTMEKVISSNVLNVGYDPESCIMRVEYSNWHGIEGTRAPGLRKHTKVLYDYFEIPEADYQAVKQAKSVGGMLNSVTSGKRYVRVVLAGEDPAAQAAAQKLPRDVMPVEGPVVRALRGTAAIMGRRYDRLDHLLWVSCGKPRKDSGTTSEQMYLQGLALVREASGNNEVDGAYVNRAIKLAAARGL